MSFKITVSKSLTVLLAVCCIVGCKDETNESPQQETKILVIVGATMGTKYAVKITGEINNQNEKELHVKINHCLREINERMSTYLPDSQVSLFNSSRKFEWFPVSQDTLTVVTRAQKISEQSEGAFDITVAPLVDIWNFGPERKTPNIPTHAEIKAAQSRISYSKIDVTQSPPALRKSHPNIEIDLSALAKGFAVDQLALLLEGAGFTDYLVEIGGEVRAKGYNKKGQPWRVGIQNPSKAINKLYQIVELKDRSLATSGDYNNYFKHEGNIYSHTIDPRTGAPVSHHLASVSVIADDCMTADAWATALMVLGPEEGMKIAEKYGVTALMIVRQESGFTTLSTPGFSNHLVE